MRGKTGGSAANGRGADSRGTDSRGTDSRGTDSRGTDSRGTDSRGTDSRGTGNGRTGKGERVAWYVPQVVLNVVNRVDWSRVPVRSYGGLATQLGMAIALFRLPIVRQAEEEPAGWPKRRLMSDVPDEVLAKLGTVDWLRLASDQHARWAQELEGAIVGRLRLPMRQIN